MSVALIDELIAYKRVIDEHTITLMKTREKLAEKLNRGGPPVVLNSWIFSLTRLSRDLQSLIEYATSNREILFTTNACMLKDKVYDLIRNAREFDPIYINLKPVLLGLTAVLSEFCGHGDRERLG